MRSFRVFSTGIAFAVTLLVAGAAWGQPVMFTVPPDGDTLTFEPTEAGTDSRPQSVKVSNVGVADLTVQRFFVGQGDPKMAVPSTDFLVTDAKGFPVNVPFDVMPNRSVTVSVFFHPTAAAKYDGYLLIEPDSVATPAVIRLSGQGTLPAPPRLACITDQPDNAIDFGAVVVGSSSAPQPMIVVDQDSKAWTILVAAQASGFTLDWSQTTVNAGRKATFQVTFSPDEVRRYSGAVTVSVMKVQSPICTIAVKGQGVKEVPADLAAPPPPVGAGCSGCALGGRGDRGSPWTSLLLVAAVVGWGTRMRRRRARERAPMVRSPDSPHRTPTSKRVPRRSSPCCRRTA